MEASNAAQAWPDSREAPDEALTAVHELEVASQSLDSPAEPMRAVSEMVGWFRSPPPDETRSLWLLPEVGSGLPLGAAWLSCQANLTAVARVVVGPAHRRAGFGGLLLDTVLVAAQEAGIRVLTGTTSHPAVRDLLVRRGATSGRVQVRQVLDLTRASRHRCASPKSLPRGVTKVSWVDTVPEEWLDAYAIARDAINDAPADAFDREVWTSERIRGLELAVTARGAQTLGTALVEEGRVIGYTEVRVSRVPGSTAATQDTAVVRDRRRLGYGGLLKSASLDHLTVMRPDVELVTTSNDETNLPMRRINRAAGFVPVALHTQLSVAL